VAVQDLTVVRQSRCMLAVVQVDLEQVGQEDLGAVAVLNHKLV
jgi:ABC-type transporter Mla MlaB component